MSLLFFNSYTFISGLLKEWSFYFNQTLYSKVTANECQIMVTEMKDALKTSFVAGRIYSREPLISDPLKYLWLLMWLLSTFIFMLGPLNFYVMNHRATPWNTSCCQKFPKYKNKKLFSIFHASPNYWVHTLLIYSFKWSKSHLIMIIGSFAKNPFY